MEKIKRREKTDRVREKSACISTNINIFIYHFYN